MSTKRRPDHPKLFAPPTHTNTALVAALAHPLIKAKHGDPKPPLADTKPRLADPTPWHWDPKPWHWHPYFGLVDPKPRHGTRQMSNTVQNMSKIHQQNRPNHSKLFAPHRHTHTDLAATLANPLIIQGRGVRHAP